MKNKERQVRQMVKACGLQLVDMHLTQSNHFKVRVRSEDGRETTHVMSKTGSDHRTQKNEEAGLKRFARGQEATA